MKKEKMSSLAIRRTLVYIVLILISILCLFWFVMLFVNATRSNGELNTGFTLMPSKFLMVNMKNLFTKSSLPVIKGMANSIIVAGLSSLLCVYFSTMTAYALQVYRFKGRNAILTFILAIMMIPTQVSALGFVDLVANMGLEDNFIPLIVPAIASPVVFFYMKQYMSANLPMSLIEAARMDGAGEFKTFNMVALPLMKPAIAVQMIFSFVTSWNNYFIPSLIITKDSKKTLPILIAQLRSADFLKFDMGQVYAMIAFSIFPVIVVYLFLSKYIVGGVTAGGVKE
jgi:multiple sugar transport system permease protein